MRYEVPKQKVGCPGGQPSFPPYPPIGVNDAMALSKEPGIPNRSAKERSRSTLPNESQIAALEPTVGTPPNGVPVPPPSSKPPNREVPENEASALLEEIAGVDDDGYIKLTPSDGGKTWYLVYLWRWGQWRGCYVLVSIERYNLDRGLQILYRKVAEVRDGTREPSPDRYYNSHPR